MPSLYPSLWTADYQITRCVFKRSLACLYLIGFLVVVNQFLPLCGEKGLQPASDFIARVRFWDAPSIFWINSSDQCLLILGWLGVVLSALALSGISESFGIWISVITWTLLWLLYQSFVNIGQTFYSFGWETLLLETGFLSIFLGSRDTKVPVLVIWLLRWLVFRLMFGAGLIKLRGDECWWNLTCMLYHYETQPMPNPLSWYFHQLPAPIHKASVLFNHFSEIIVPFGYFFYGLVAALAGIITIVFQLLLIISGNFSWLNWLTIVLCISCLNDHYLRFFPIHPRAKLVSYGAHRFAVYALTALVGILSLAPASNLLARRQLMNASFEPFHIVNTYGAFGSITKVRREIIIEGSSEATPSSDWKEYEFKGKPGDIHHTPPQLAPYHLRLDWLMWFAPFTRCENNPWFINLLHKLLEGDQAILGLMRYNPFPDRPPRFIRATLYEYHFTSPAERKESGAIWKRKLLGLYCPLLTAN